MLDKQGRNWYNNHRRNHAVYPMQKWWNRQTRYLEGVVTTSRTGSSPVFCTKNTGECKPLCLCFLYDIRS